MINKIIEGLQMNVAKDNIEAVIESFMALLAECRENQADSAKDVQELRTELLMLSAKLSGIEKENRMGIIDIAHYNLSKNKIRMGLIHLLDHVQDYDAFYFFLEEKEEENAWAIVIEQNTIAAYEDYFRRYPKGKYIAKTEQIISELKSQLKRKAEEEKERRKVLKNISFDQRTHKRNQHSTDQPSITSPMDWWKSIPANWQKVLAAEVGFIGQAKEKNIQRILRLKIIDLSNQQQIRSLTPISHLNNVRTLNLFNTGVESLEGVSTLTNLEEINIAHTQIKSLKPLFELKNLRSLVHSNLSTLELNTFRQFQPNCKVLQKN